MKLAKLWNFVDWMKLLEKGKYYKTDLIGCVAAEFRENTNYFDLLIKT